MICATVKAGTECAFMTKSGCGFNGGSCKPVVEQCEGCTRTTNVEAGTFCTSYPNPAAKWRTSQCNFATHVKKETQSSQKVNPLKASKRATKRK
jgi:hypothetical protein